MKASQRVRPDTLRDPGAPGDATHDPTGGVPVQSPSVTFDEDRSFGLGWSASFRRDVRCEGDGVREGAGATER